jgi:hypothetical protein
LRLSTLLGVLMCKTCSMDVLVGGAGVPARQTGSAAPLGVLGLRCARGSRGISAVRAEMGRCISAGSYVGESAPEQHLMPDDVHTASAHKRSLHNDEGGKSASNVSAGIELCRGKGKSRRAGVPTRFTVMGGGCRSQAPSTRTFPIPKGAAWTMPNCRNGHHTRHLERLPPVG